MRRPDSYAPPRRRRGWSLAVGFGLVATLVPLAGAGPAGAAPAPLITEDGIGLRVDETAIQGPALEAIETATQPFVDDLIYDGGVDGAPIDDYEWLAATSNLELSFDVLPPSVSRPDGGIAVHADILNIQLEYRADPPWPFGDCSIYIRPANATIDASASVDRDALPAAPLVIDPIQATWDDDPDVSTTGVCWGYLIDDLFEGWWDDFVGNDPESTASKIEAQLNGIAQDLIDQIWDENVAPVLDSLDSFGISINQLHTDDHGLIVTADVDATGGVTIPGMPGGPFDVSGAEDSGADSDVNTLLANRTSDDGAAEVIASVHPNVVNQYTSALDQFLGGSYGATPIPASIEAVLLEPADRALYNDANWTIRMFTLAQPYTQPTGTESAPQLQLPVVRLQLRNGLTTVATFEGTLSGLDLITEIRSGDTTWGPGFRSNNAALSVTRTQANVHAAKLPPQSGSAILPYAQIGFDQFNDSIFVQWVTLAPIELFGMSVDLCTTCGRYSGDERYTETFKVN
jgi:hypothetical protein